MAWKYVIAEARVGSMLMLFPVIFPDKLVHSEVFRDMRKTLSRHGFQDINPHSAGKIEHLDVEGLGGGSETLAIASDPGDTKVIEMYSYLHGIKP